MRRIFLSALIGACSIFFLFIPLTTLSLFLLKILVSILMIFIAFPYTEIKSFLKELTYLYMISIFLGGFLYFVELRLNYSNEGILFYHNGLGVNVLAMIIITPLIICFYVKEIKRHKTNYNNYRNVEIYLNKHTYSYTGYIDTGNRLKDPYQGRSIILLYSEKKIPVKHYLHVPFQTLNNNGIIKCFKVDKVVIEDKEYHDLLIGLSKDKFHIEGVDCILPNKIKEEI